MSVVEDIYRALEENLGNEQEVLVEDLIRYGCWHRHHLQLGGAARKPLRAQDILLREAERNILGTVRGYFKRAFDEFSVGGVQVLEGTVTVDIFGSFPNAVVEVVATPLSEIGKIPGKEVRLAAAVKAYLMGKNAAWIVTIDRNTQSWYSFYMEGDFTDVGEMIRAEANYLQATTSGRIAESDFIGLASSSTCSRCPFEPVCTVAREPDPAQLQEVEIALRLEPSLVTRLNEYLQQLNEKSYPTSRRISPSGFTGRAASSCDRAVAYGLLGKPMKSRIAPGLRRIFDMGHAFHHVIQAAMFWAYPGFREEVKGEHALNFRGSCDGVWGNRAAEIKSISVSGFDSTTSPKKEHRQQATIYAKIIEGIEIIVYIYANKNTGELRSFEVRPSNDLWHEMALRATRVNKAVQAYEKEGGHLPPKIDKDYVCFDCDYAWICRPDLIRRVDSQQRARST